MPVEGQEAVSKSGRWACRAGRDPRQGPPSPSPQGRRDQCRQCLGRPGVSGNPERDAVGLGPGQGFLRSCRVSRGQKSWHRSQGRGFLWDANPGAQRCYCVSRADPLGHSADPDHRVSRNLGGRFLFSIRPRIKEASLHLSLTAASQGPDSVMLRVSVPLSHLQTTQA